MKLNPEMFAANEAWIITRLDTLMFVKDEPADIDTLRPAKGHILPI